MIVQSTSASFFAAEIARSPSPRQNTAASQANIADTVRISQAAREALAASSSSSAANNDKSIEARLAEIRARGPVNRSHEDQDFLFANDKKLAEISAKPYNARTADDIDYMQKATGFVNTFAHLSSAEKTLYDKAVASGNTAAAEGIAQIALIRQGGEMAGGANGTTYNSRTTEITVANIERYFRHSIVDPSGNTESKFQALIQFLQNNPVV
jgi:hypothetical protein